MGLQAFSIIAEIGVRALHDPKKSKRRSNKLRLKSVQHIPILLCFMLFAWVNLCRKCIILSSFESKHGTFFRVEKLFGLLRLESRRVRGDGPENLTVPRRRRIIIISLINVNVGCVDRIKSSIFDTLSCPSFVKV